MGKKVLQFFAPFKPSPWPLHMPAHSVVNSPSTPSSALTTSRTSPTSDKPALAAGPPCSVSLTYSSVPSVECRRHHLQIHRFSLGQEDLDCLLRCHSGLFRTRQWYSLWYNWRHRKSWWYHLCHYLPVLFQLVLMSLLDGSDRFLRTRLV